MPRKPPIKMSGNGKIPVKTKPQTSGRSGIGIWDGLISGTQCIGSDSRRDLYRVYREMRNHPTIALARAAAYAPMRNAAWRIDADEDVPEEMQLAIQADLLRLRDDLLANMLRAMDYGWQSFERIPTFTADHWAIARLKPLLPELTEIVTDKQTGEFTGLRQRDVILAPEECFIFTYDPEADDLYGRSRNENLRQIWKASTTLLEQQVGYNRRVAGVIPIIRYPRGEGTDRSGGTVNNFDVGVAIESRLGGNRGIVVPNELAPWAESLLRSGVPPDKLRAWDFEFLESGVQHGTAFVEQHRYFDSLMLRGWLVPERAVIEGQYGTKAEAATHGDVALRMAEDTLGEFVRQINAQLVADLVRWNYGEEWVGRLRLATEPMVDDTREFYRSLMVKLLDPTMLDVFAELTDLADVAARAGLPIPKEVES